MARRTTMAVDGITSLAENADSEAIRLKALRAILADQISVAKFSVLEQRMVEIEEHIQAQAGMNFRTLCAWVGERSASSTNVPLRRQGECDGLNKTERRSRPGFSRLL